MRCRVVRWVKGKGYVFVAEGVPVWRAVRLAGIYATGGWRRAAVVDLRCYGRASWGDVLILAIR